MEIFTITKIEIFNATLNVMKNAVFGSLRRNEFASFSSGEKKTRRESCLRGEVRGKLGKDVLHSQLRTV